MHLRISYIAVAAVSLLHVSIIESKDVILYLALHYSECAFEIWRLYFRVLGFLYLD